MPTPAPSAPPIDRDFTPRFTISPPTCSLNPATTYESPFFWLILGAAGATAVFYLIKKGHL